MDELGCQLLLGCRQFHSPKGNQQLLFPRLQRYQRLMRGHGELYQRHHLRRYHRQVKPSIDRVLGRF